MTLLKATPSRGTGFTWAAACRSGRLAPTARTAANRATPAVIFIERIVIAVYLAKPLTRRTIPIRTGEATTKGVRPSGKMGQYGFGYGLGLVQIGQMAGIRDG